ncbi:MAG: hypothetical protein ACRCZ0_12590 [Cetobacterium sp.]
MTNEQTNISVNLTRNNFTMVSNAMLLNENLTLGAKGLLSLMLSRPADWQFFKSELVKRSADSEHSVTKILKELTDKNYLYRFKIGNKGKGAGFTWIWIFKDVELTKEEIEKVKSLYNSKVSTTPLINDTRWNGVYSNTNLYSNTKNIKNHDREHVILFEKLFKEKFIGINYTTTNQSSVKKLLKTMSEKQVIEYLTETYESIISNEDIKNKAGLFSSKISKGERQINIIATGKNKTNKENEVSEKFNKTEKDREEKIKMEFEEVVRINKEAELNSEKARRERKPTEEETKLALEIAKKENLTFYKFTTPIIRSILKEKGLWK